MAMPCPARGMRQPSLPVSARLPLTSRSRAEAVVFRAQKGNSLRLGLRGRAHQLLFLLPRTSTNGRAPSHSPSGKETNMRTRQVLAALAVCAGLLLLAESAQAQLFGRFPGRGGVYINTPYYSYGYSPYYSGWYQPYYGNWYSSYYYPYYSGWYTAPYSTYGWNYYS